MGGRYWGLIGGSGEASGWDHSRLLKLLGDLTLKGRCSEGREAG